MQNDQIPESHHLPNKPLVEAIFELRWELKELGCGIPPHDPGFRIALGRYYDQVRNDYPFMVDLPTAQVPEDMTAYSVRHQFRVAEGKWPLTQLGPGILTVNETENYDWDDFEPRLQKAVSSIFNSYPNDISPFSPSKIQLRYIDAIEVGKNDPISFLRDFLHTTIEVEPLLSENPKNPDSAERLRLNLTYPLTQPKGVGIMSFSSGYHNDKNVILLEITISSDGEDVPRERENISKWIEDSHKITDKWFFTLCRGELMKKFEEQ